MTGIVLLLMSLLAWRLGVFDEWVERRRLHAFDRDLWLDIDEANWEDRQQKFRREHAPRGYRRAGMSLGRRR